jgi:leader peptidase (prepilin peptidase)/N-methyltransferase
MNPNLVLHALVFVVGACIGSFLNVCIFRIPAGRSIVFPPSACPRCGTAIRALDNVPLLSWVWLRGRCRHCRAPISGRYPLVELLTGLMALGILLRFGWQPLTAVYFAFGAALIAITFIDLDHQIIPDVITLPGIPLALLGSLLVPEVTGWDAVIGVLAGGGSLYLVALGYRLLTGADGMGGGDIKLLAMIGALVGWQGVLFTIFFSSALGTLVGLAYILATRRTAKARIPFGPFLAVGAMAYLFVGPPVIRWYLSWMR